MEHSMKNRRQLVIALAITLLAPLPLLAQGGAQGRGAMGGVMSARLLIDQGSVEYLVTRAADLTLNEDQRTQLEAIAVKWADATRDSREQIKGMLPQRGQAAGADREAMMQRLEQARPLAEKLTEDDQKALDEALKVLDDAQREKAKALLDERRQNARPRRAGGGA
jgi:Spy/CpxP family protein refolding chaperone